MSQSNHKLNWLKRPAASRAFPLSGKQKPSWTISRKILRPVIVFTAILMLTSSAYMYVSTRQRDRAETEDTLYRMEQITLSQLDSIKTLALGLATQTVNSPEIQAAFAAQDRELLTELALPTFNIIHEDFAVKQYQFFLPPATSFLRLHQLDKFGDDLSSIRATFLKMNETQAAVSGIEIGRGGLGVRGVVPVSYQGKYLGGLEVGLDIGPDFLNKLKKQYGVEVQLMLEKEAAQTATFAGSTAETVGPTENLLFQASTLTKPFYADASIYPRVLAGESVISTINVNNRTYAAISFPLKDYSGKVIGVLEIFLDRTDILAIHSRSLLITILTSLAIMLLGGFLITRFINRTILPISTLTETASAVAAGNLERKAIIESGDEIGILANAFNDMTSRMRELISGLETRVAERTRNLELAAEVGRSVSQVRDLDAMLKDACDLILKEFGLYYVQVYLTDASQTNLILEAGTGDVGVQLLGRGHTLQLNTGSINGRAAMEKRPVVISDTAQSATFRQNPLLPDTRGEMAVPLIVADKVVGVLDMQSNVPGILNTEVLPAFEALAGQMAVAIQNANLLEETEQARAQVESQARRLVRTGWNEHLDAIHKPEQLGFVFDHNQIIPLTEMDETQLREVGNFISAPIAVTGEALGSLVVELEDETREQQTSELVRIVARQVAQQIENLRLLESAERYRLEAEEASRRITREGWKSYAENANGNLSYVYDLNEVRVVPERDQQAESSGYTLPLQIREETIGRLVVQGLDTGDGESIRLANAVVERLGVHIESLRQYDQAQSALTQSEKLFEASSSLTRATDLQELVTASITTLGISEVNRALLVTFDYDAKGELSHLDVIANWWNGTGHEVTAIGTQYPLEVIRVMPMFISQTPVFFDDTLTDERVDATTLGLVKRLNLRSVAVLPLHVGSYQMGALILEAEEPHHFTQEETRLFSALAPQIATVVENRRQFEQAQKQAERETRLNVISQKIQSATTVEAVLQIAARELGHTLGAPLTIAQLGLRENSNGN